MMKTHEAQIESAVADVQLLGSSEQVRLAKELARRFDSDCQADITPLLESLRSSFRRELLLGKDESRKVGLRISSRSR
jgi:hypothetical protein